jgi:hypothetical protein
MACLAQNIQWTEVAHMKTMKTMGEWVVVTGFAALIAVSGNTLARDLDDIPGVEESRAWKTAALRPVRRAWMIEESMTEE